MESTIKGLKAGILKTLPQHYFKQPCKNACGRNRRDKSAYCQKCSTKHNNITNKQLISWLHF
jgi:hypothetical protein